MEVKKLFALASVTALTGFVAWPSVSPQLAHLVREDSLPY